MLNSEVFATRAEMSAREAEKCTLPQTRNQLILAAEVWREKSRYASQFESRDVRATIRSKRQSISLQGAAEQPRSVHRPRSTRRNLLLRKLAAPPRQHEQP